MSAEAIAGWRERTHVVSWRTCWQTVELWTEDGSCGLGEWSDAGSWEATGGLRRSLADELVGRDVGSALHLVQALSVAAAGRVTQPDSRAELTILGGLDAALCDLAAREAGVPLARWYGGKPAATRCYANINRAVASRTPDEFARVARAAVAAGFRAVKCAPFDFLLGARRLAGGLEIAEAVMDAVGAGVEVMLDLHENLSPGELGAAAPVLRALAPRWVEDAAPLDDLERLESARKLLDVPMAGGEFAAGVEQIEPAVCAGLLDVVMPDVKHAGGPRRALDIARFALESGVEVSFHNPTGPVSTAHSAAAAASLPSPTVLELAFGEVEWRSRVLEPTERMENGTLISAGGVGLAARLADRDFGEPPPPYPGWAAGRSESTGNG